MARSDRSRAPAFGIFFTVGIITLGGYFVFAAVQGEYGVFRRIQIEAEADLLRHDATRLQAEIDALRNKTHRLSDDYLDLDLLDERARDVLGLVRSDEIVIQ